MTVAKCINCGQPMTDCLKEFEEKKETMYLPKAMQEGKRNGKYFCSLLCWVEYKKEPEKEVEKK